MDIAAEKKGEVSTQSNPYIEITEFLTEKDLLEKGFAKICQGRCKRAIRVRRLDENGFCPDCVKK